VLLPERDRPGWELARELDRRVRLAGERLRDLAAILPDERDLARLAAFLAAAERGSLLLFPIAASHTADNSCTQTSRKKENHNWANKQNRHISRYINGRLPESRKVDSCDNGCHGWRNRWRNLTMVTTWLLWKKKKIIITKHNTQYNEKKTFDLYSLDMQDGSVMLKCATGKIYQMKYQTKTAKWWNQRATIFRTSSSREAVRLSRRLRHRHQDDVVWYVTELYPWNAQQSTP